MVDGCSITYLGVKTKPLMRYFLAYEKYVLSKYGKATIVFDGFGDKLSTKSEAHRKQSGFEEPKVNFLPAMAITMKKDIFLSNKVNKQSFMIYLCNKLGAAGCTTKQAEADADVTIVTGGIASAQKYPTAIIGEDTDLLILLIHDVNIQCCDIFLFPEPKKSSRYVTVYDIKQIDKNLAKKSVLTFFSLMQR
ncbi:hypothetical protein PR048_004745 [Dryococelus australis]|uniref:Uncharacterized protein n=1 Tax=Dryococelus australis TaxID=614101 RepID=A0ABQ9I7A2_9NEOP|nr:hypothetical protein PR048_004745 [Dryococelus australis]